MEAPSMSSDDSLINACNELIKISEGDNTEEKVAAIIRLLTITKELKTKNGGDNIVISIDLLKCLRLMLVDEDKSIRVQSCRAMRYITCNKQILDDMISLNIPIFMMICLERQDNKFLWERMQSLKWIRHLMDNFALFIPKCCIMSLIGIAQNGKDEFRRICLDSLRELCITNPAIISKCNGFKVLIDSILNPQLNDISNSLVLTILYIVDHPETRKYLRPHLDIQRLLAPFVHVNPYKTDAQTKEELAEQERRRDIARKTLITMLKSITGIFYLGGDQGQGGLNNKHRKNKKCFLRILVDLMRLPNAMKGIQWARECIFSVLENALLPLSDSYKLDHQRGPNLIVNYVCLILMAFIKNGLIECLVDVGMRSDLELAPRARTLLQRIQFLSAKYLPSSLCSRITNLERVMRDAAVFDYGVKKRRGIHNNNNNNNKCTCSCHNNKKTKKKKNLSITVRRNFANMMISELTEGASIEEMYTVINDDDSREVMDFEYISSSLICHRLGPEFDLNSTFIRYRYVLSRDIPSLMFQDRIPFHCHRVQDTIESDEYKQFGLRAQRVHILESLKDDQNASYTESVILSMLKQTQVILTKDFMLWNMNSVWRVLNGPLWNGDNLSIALNKTKFIKRLIQYLKPSRSFFCQLKWSIHTIRHAQCAAQLFRLLISSSESVRNQYFQELVSEIFAHLRDQIECNLDSSQHKRVQLSHSPFSPSSIRYTLSRTYLILIGILSENQRGIELFHRHHMFAFLFPLTRKEMTDHSLSKHRSVGPNDYLLRLIATNLDYTQSADFRMLYPQWMSSGSYYLRKCLITHLELLYRAGTGINEWSINVLAVILKDREARLALTALKVLENIMCAPAATRGDRRGDHNLHHLHHLCDLIATQPTDSIIGFHGQFLFIKMLSTKQGFHYLSTNTQWINSKRREWSQYFHHRYTAILEAGLAHSIKQSDVDGEDQSYYHLLHENRSDEEELYHEYLSQFAWNLSCQIIEPSGHEIEIETDCFFDYNCFSNNDGSKDGELKQIGAGVHAITTGNIHAIDKNARIKISINIGHETLDDLYQSSKTLTKVVQMCDLSKENVIHNDSDQLWLFFDDKTHLKRIFWSLSSSSDNGAHSLVRPLPHFYGELCKTETGCNFIIANDEFESDLTQYISTISNPLSSGASANDHLELRSCLWAIGMIGSSISGLNLLHTLCIKHNRQRNICDDICILTQQSPTLSIRGTCLYVLGLLSRTKHGMQQLLQYGFHFPADNIEFDLGVAIPSDINAFFNLGECEYIESPYLNRETIQISCYSPPSLCRPANMKAMDPNELLGKQGHTEETVLAHISGLTNNVTYASSRYQLQRLRNKKPSVFQNPLLFRETLKLLNVYQFKLPAKRFVLFSLFDKVIYKESNAIELFNESIYDQHILSFHQIREWRYNYKQKQIQKKQEKQKEKLLKKQQLQLEIEVEVELKLELIADPKQQEFDEEKLFRKQLIMAPEPLNMKQLSMNEEEEIIEKDKLPTPNNATNDLQKRAESIGYEHDLAESPNKVALGHGPNPLSFGKSNNDT